MGGLPWLIASLISVPILLDIAGQKQRGEEGRRALDAMNRKQDELIASQDTLIAAHAEMEETLGRTKDEHLKQKIELLESQLALAQREEEYDSMRAVAERAVNLRAQIRRRRE